MRGELKIVKRSTGPLHESRAWMGRHLHAARPGHLWPEEIIESSNRFIKEKGPVRLTLVEPVVVEVSADVARVRHVLRHPVTYRRTRRELNASEARLIVRSMDSFELA